MEVEIRYFAGAREATGLQVERIALAAGSDVEALLDCACERHPALEPLRAGLRVAIDEHFAAGHAALHEGAVVALIPPVGGG